MPLSASFIFNAKRLAVSVLIGSLFFSAFSASAAPAEIIVIRHADKWPGKHHGPALDPTGYLRAVRFAFYFLEKFGEPDFLIATNPDEDKANSRSIRELQTLAPLANLLAKESQTKTAHRILHPYRTSEYEELAALLLTDERFTGKRVLICWGREQISKLTAELGVEQPLPKWSKRTYDDVYVIRYDEKGEILKFTHLTNQYPVSAQTWDGFLARP